MLRHLHTVHSLDAEVCGSNDWCAAKGITKRLVDIPDGTGVTPLMYAGSNAHEDLRMRTTRLWRIYLSRRSQGPRIQEQGQNSTARFKRTSAHSF